MFLRKLTLLLNTIAHATIVNGFRDQCARLDSLPDPCRCSFNSLVICEDLRNSTVLDSLFESIVSDSVEWLDGLRLVNVRTQVFHGLRRLVARDVAKIQSFEIKDSELSRLTSVWNNLFWNGHEGTFSLAIHRTSGLDTWNWASIAAAFPSLQYLEIDRSFIRALPEDFALNFDQLLGLTVTRSHLMVIGQRAVYCSMCKSIRLAYNDIRNINISSIATQDGSMLHLDLRYNSLKILPSGFFHNLAHVATLRVDLDGNPIEHLEANLFEPLFKLSRVDIRYMRGILRCDCSLNNLSQKPFDLEHISCREPPNFETNISLAHFLIKCLPKQEL